MEIQNNLVLSETTWSNKALILQWKAGQHNETENIVNTCKNLYKHSSKILNAIRTLTSEKSCLITSHKIRKYYNFIALKQNREMNRYITKKTDKI